MMMARVIDREGVGGLLPGGALILLFCIALWLLPAGAPTQAAQAVPLADNPELQARMKRLEYELRCLVCQAESVAESSSEFSQDIRREVARMMEEGMTDQQIRQFLVDRYGDFILFRPPVNSATMLLWGGPLLLLLIGAAATGVILMRRRKSAAGGTRLSEEEHKRASSLLTAGEGKGEGGR